jgi:hypothetical protein
MESLISPLSNDMKNAMTGRSWNSSCPVPLEDLSAVRVSYFGFDSGTHEGVIVVHKRFAKEC